MRLSALLSSAMVAGCASAPVEELTSLEKQQMQSREVDGDKRLVFNSVVSVLQDAGYLIQEADFKTGLVTGSGETKGTETSPPPAEDFLDNLLQGAGGDETLSRQTSVSVFVQEWGEGRVKVRAMFAESKLRQRQKMVSGKKHGPVWKPAGNYVDSETIYDPAVYTNFFDALDQTIFVTRATTNPQAD